MTSTRSVHRGRKRDYTNALQLSDQDQNMPRRNQRVDVSQRTRENGEMDIDEDQADSPGVILVDHATGGHEAESRAAINQDSKIELSSVVKSEEGQSEHQLALYRQAHSQHDATIRTLEARIRTGEYGLGELVQELNGIQRAIARREHEIGKLSRDLREERQSRQECEIMIERLQNL